MLLPPALRMTSSLGSSGTSRTWLWRKRRCCHTLFWPSSGRPKPGHRLMECKSRSRASNQRSPSPSHHHPPPRAPGAARSAPGAVPTRPLVTVNSQQANASGSPSHSFMPCASRPAVRRLLVNRCTAVSNTACAQTQPPWLPLLQVFSLSLQLHSFHRLACFHALLHTFTWKAAPVLGSNQQIKFRALADTLL